MATKQFEQIQLSNQVVSDNYQRWYDRYGVGVSAYKLPPSPEDFSPMMRAATQYFVENAARFKGKSRTAWWTAFCEERKLPGCRCVIPPCPEWMQDFVEKVLQWRDKK